MKLINNQGAGLYILHLLPHVRVILQLSSPSSSSPAMMADFNLFVPMISDHNNINSTTIPQSIIIQCTVQQYSTVKQKHQSFEMSGS